MLDIFDDGRTVMTLDAGGTNFVFSAIRGGKEIVEPIVLPSLAHDLSLSLKNISDGFWAVREKLEAIQPVAISFAFPGPADYPRGIVGNLANLPAFRGGVALGPMLQRELGIPVYMNNDGNLFAYGEAIAGFLPYVNGELERAGSAKRLKNLVGFTLGTGIGGGVVVDGRLLIGDNSMGAEVWSIAQRHHQNLNIEESVSIRAVRGAYAEICGMPFEDAPEPREIYRIGVGEAQGNREAAVEAYRRMGQALGDIICNVVCVVDSVVVIGGGVSGARELFVPAMFEEMRSTFTAPSGAINKRLDQRIFDLDSAEELAVFCKGEEVEIEIPNAVGRTVTYDPMARIGVGFSKLGASKAISIGAYAFALSELDK